MIPTISSTSAVKPMLIQVPKEIKGMIVNCLSFPDLTSACVVNKSWKSIIDNTAVWSRAAKQMTKGNIAPGRAHDYCLYNPILQEFYNIANQITPKDEQIIKILVSFKSDSEKYNLLKDYLKNNRVPLQLYIANISNKVLTKDEIFYAKMVISDFVLSRETSTVKEVIQDIELSFDDVTRAIVLSSLDPESNSELFNFTLGKLKNSPKHRDIFRLATRYRYIDTPFLKILLDAGARPECRDILEALEKDLGEEYLRLLLDYTKNSVRDKALSNLKKKLDEELNIGKYEGAQDDYDKARAAIVSAPQPSFGGLGKDPTDTCCVIL